MKMCNSWEKLFWTDNSLTSVYFLQLSMSRFFKNLSDFFICITCSMFKNAEQFLLFFFKSSPAVWISEPSFTHGSNCPLDIARWIMLVMSRRQFMQKILPVNWVPLALFKIIRLFPWPGLTQLSSSLTERTPKGDNCSSLLVFYSSF